MNRLSFCLIGFFSVPNEWPRLTPTAALVAQLNVDEDASSVRRSKDQVVHNYLIFIGCSAELACLLYPPRRPPPSRRPGYAADSRSLLITIISILFE